MKSNKFNQWLKQLPKPIRFVVIIVLIITAAIFKEDIFTPSPSIQLEEVTLKRVVDGDTIIVLNKNKEELRVRLIGIDTPESVHADADKNTVEGQQLLLLCRESFASIMLHTIRTQNNQSQI